tara:strand:- start:465 stop:752 length:288 start_codon:yes stop_codon:yes gene_type:complete
MGISVNDNEFQKMLKALDKLPTASMKDAYPFLRNKTPVRGGNARNKTKLRKNTIRSDYGYADRLDNGWSKQAPNGFTEPTIRELDNIVEQKIKRL